MKIYTKTGDRGMTSLVGGQRVAKNSARLESYGTVDELNSCLGIVRAYVSVAETAEELVEIQSRLFDLGGNLATDPADLKVKVCIREEDIAFLEHAIDRMDAALPPMRYFVLPGGSPAQPCLPCAILSCRAAVLRYLFAIWRGLSAGGRSGALWIWQRALRSIPASCNTSTVCRITFLSFRANSRRTRGQKR